MGRLDIWIKIAAMIEVGEIAETSAADWDRVVMVNLRGVFLGCRTAAGFLKRQGQGGRILNASSVSGMRGGALVGAYAASKAGVIGLTQSLAAELGPHAITVNAYCPGNVTSTRMWEVVDRGIAHIEGARPATRSPRRSQTSRSRDRGPSTRSPPSSSFSRRSRRRSSPEPATWSTAARCGSAAEVAAVDRQHHPVQVVGRP